MIKAEFPSLWRDYNNRRRFRRWSGRLLWMAFGGLFVLVSLPYFPSAWAGWIGDRQDTITESVNWGDTPQRSVIVPNTAAYEIRVESPELATRGDTATYSLIDRQGTTRSQDLVLDKKWSGTGDQGIDFDASTEPWVLVWEFDVTSSLAHHFRIGYIDSQIRGQLDFTDPFGQAMLEGMSIAYDSAPNSLIPNIFGNQHSKSWNHSIISDSGEGRIVVDAAGVEWTVWALTES